MKKMLPALLLLLTGSIVYGQDNEALKTHYLKVYQQGKKYNDVSTAIIGLQGYIALHDNISYKDSLSMLYFSIKNYYTALLLSEEVYKAEPANTQAMARAAECYSELGDPKTSVTLYEQVTAKLKYPYYLYMLAVGQYQLKRTGESEMSARAVIADTSSKRIGVNFVSVDGTTQAVPVNAAAYNLLGVLKMEVKNYTAAKTDFEEALKLYPQFAGAKQNMEACENKLKDVNKSSGKPK